MAYGYPYPQTPSYFNTNYMPPQVQQMPQAQVPQGPSLISVPDELTARNAQFPMDGSPVYFVNSNGAEIYSKQLSMADGSVIFRRYKREQEPQNPAAPAYVTREELNAKLEELYQLLGTATDPKKEGSNNAK